MAAGLLDREAERRALAEDVALADEALQGRRAHAHGERRLLGLARRRRLGEEVSHGRSTPAMGEAEDYSQPILAGGAASDYERYLNTELLALQKGEASGCTGTSSSSRSRTSRPSCGSSCAGRTPARPLA